MALLAWSTSTHFGLNMNSWQREIQSYSTRSPISVPFFFFFIFFISFNDFPSRDHPQNQLLGNGILTFENIVRNFLGNFVLFFLSFIFYFILFLFFFSCWQLEIASPGSCQRWSPSGCIVEYTLCFDKVEVSNISIKDGVNKSQNQNWVKACVKAESCEQSYHTQIQVALTRSTVCAKSQRPLKSVMTSCRLL